MKVTQVRSRISGMVDWAVKDDNGEIHIIDKDSQGRLMCYGVPGLEHPVIARMLSNARARMSRKAKESAYESCGMVKVRGALGGTYWE
jgi:hypothetical protein